MHPPSKAQVAVPTDRAVVPGRNHQAPEDRADSRDHQAPVAAARNNSKAARRVVRDSSRVKARHPAAAGSNKAHDNKDRAHHKARASNPVRVPAVKGRVRGSNNRDRIRDNPPRHNPTPPAQRNHNQPPAPLPAAKTIARQAGVRNNNPPADRHKINHRDNNNKDNSQVNHKVNRKANHRVSSRDNSPASSKASQRANNSRDSKVRDSLASNPPTPINRARHNPATPAHSRARPQARSNSRAR